MLIIDNEQKNVYLSGRNVQCLQIKRLDDINAYDIMSNENIIFCSEELVGKVEKVTAL